MRIAFLGLGHMGLPMARNLVAAGHDVVGFDVFPAARDAARESGLAVAESATDAVRGVPAPAVVPELVEGSQPHPVSEPHPVPELVEGSKPHPLPEPHPVPERHPVPELVVGSPSAEVVITMFQTGRQVLDAYRGVDGAEGLLAAAVPGTLFIDSSTIAVDEARAAAALAAAAGHRALDAPVSGGVVGAENATLAFMVGGAAEDFEAARPVLEAMGRRVVHCGDAGLGQAAKVCNNMILAVSQIAVAEAFVLGERLGLSHQALFDVASNASGQCWALTTNCPVPGPVPTSPANRDYQPGFAGSLMSKDLGLAEQALDLTGVGARMGRLAREIYQEFADGPGARQDFSGIIHTIRADSAAPA